MQRDAAELIEFWRKKFEVALPNKDLDLYEIEKIVYYYRVSDIIRFVNKLKTSDIYSFVSRLNKKPEALSFEWSDKITSTYNWIVTHYYTNQMSWFDFDILLKMSIEYGTNAVCGAAQQLLNEQKPIHMKYLFRVMESTKEEQQMQDNVAKQIVDRRRTNISSNTTKESIDPSGLQERFMDDLDEI